jgi:hypothetical protein
VTTDNAWSTFQEINGWIRQADTKAATVLAAGGVLGGLLVSTPPTRVDGLLGTVRIACYVLAVVVIVLSLLVSLQALLPRLRVPRNPMSVLYFDHIAAGFPEDPGGFQDAFLDLAEDAETMNRALAAQIWANSLVAQRKFRRVAYATWLIGAAMFCSGVAVLLQHI